MIAYKSSDEVVPEAASTSKEAEGDGARALRPTTIPRFDVADYARRCDASLRGSIVGAMPPLMDLARRYRTPKIREKAQRSERRTMGLAALLRTFVDEPG